MTVRKNNPAITSDDEIKKLTIKQANFIEEYLKDGNLTRAAYIAYNCKDMNSAGSLGYTCMQNPAIVAEIQHRRADLRESFKQEATQMFAELVTMVYNPNTPPKVKLDAIKDILDRAGYKPVDKQEINGSMTLDTPATREMLQRARIKKIEG